MLSCKNCGAQMSGVDLVCKKCGTPWGKKHKSRKKIYFSIFAILLVACGAYVYFTPDVDKAPIIEIYNKYFASKNTDKEAIRFMYTGQQLQISFLCCIIVQCFRKPFI